MKKKLFIFALVITYFVCRYPSTAVAVENPLGVPNNKIGIHILFDYELSDAAKLVNTDGGEWGYVIIPIQSGDKDIVKWQKFMDNARNLHVIPIIRLATEGDYFNTKVWRKPEEKDIIDFANFLNSLVWPTKNRYIVVFNEVNRGDEWGGEANPQEYASMLSYAVTVFKSRNNNFFIISAGLDNAAPNQGNTYINQYTYMTLMNSHVPGIFNQIDGFSSHSYPNPAFSQPPSSNTSMSISSFRFERQLIQSLSNKKLPVFITETGWSSERLSKNTIVSYYKEAFSNVWSDEGIVAITPFLLKAGGGPFVQFSFLGTNNEETQQYQFLKNLPKIKGQPPEEMVLNSKSVNASEQPFKNFSSTANALKNHISISSALQTTLAWIFKL